MADQRLAKIWPSIIEAIEASLPYYDRVNQIISLGLAAKMRRTAIESLQKDQTNGGCLALDLGIGPGNMSLQLLEAQTRVEAIVGVDYSTVQLSTAKKKLATAGFNAFHPARAIFEHLPLRDEIFQYIYSGFALRDAVDKASSVRELYRVSRRGGTLVIVDMGKPDNLITRALMTFYITLIMPLLAKLIIHGRVHGNPWQKLAATYKTLPCNRQTLATVRNLFGIDAAKLTPRLLGGLVLIRAEKK